MDEKPVQTEIPNKKYLDESQKLDPVDKDRIFRTVGDENTPVNVDELIKGYMFGQTLVPVTGTNKHPFMPFVVCTVRCVFNTYSLFRG